MIQWQDVLSLLEQMKASNVERTAVTYNSVIDACACAEAWQHADALLQQMEHEVKLHSIYYLLVVRTCSRCAVCSVLNIEFAMSFWSPLASASHNTLAAVVHSSCRSIAYIAIAGDHCRRLYSLFFFAYLRTGTLLLQQGIGPTAVTHNSVLNAYAKGAQPVKAEALLSSMGVQGIARSVKAYNCVIAANAAAGRWQRAVYWVHELPRRCVFVLYMPLHYTVCTSACSRVGTKCTCGKLCLLRAL
jgi:pentatricopeptide repeat protein